MASPWIHIYKDVVTIGSVDGNIVSEGTGTNPITVNSISKLNEEFMIIKLSIRCDLGYSTLGNTTITPIGTSSLSWALSLDGSTWGEFGSPLTITSSIGIVNVIFWVKVKITSDTVASTDSTVDLQVNTTVSGSAVTFVVDTSRTIKALTITDIKPYLIFLATTTDLSRFTKQSTEKYPFDINFSDILVLGETITTVQVDAYLNGSLVAGIISSYGIVNDVANDYYVVRTTVKDGINKNVYKVTVKVTTSSENVYEKDVFVSIRDI